MKTKINYFLIKQIRAHLLYILSLLLFVGGSIAIGVILDTYKQSHDEKSVALKKEIAALQQKKDFLNYRKDLDENSLDNIDNLNTSLTQLFPESEDYFSIIVALERLSQQTNFIINSYTITLPKTSSPDKLSLIITGQGDRESFLTFLQQYNFSGGRLITIDKISYTAEEAFSGTKLGINVYHGKTVAKNTIPVLTQEEQDLLQSIRSKMSISIKNDSLDTATIDYPTKNIPF